MKKTIILILLLSNFYAVTQTKTQTKTKTPYPKSVIDIGLGLGPNYGMLGGNALVGYKGTGLLMSFGTTGATQAFGFYLQVSHEWVFLNFGRGVTGLAIDEYTNISSNIVGNSFSVGGKINLDYYKRAFLLLSVGYQESSIKLGFRIIDTSGPIFGVGFGYRISFSKSDYKRYRKDKIANDVITTKTSK